MVLQNKQSVCKLDKTQFSAFHLKNINVKRSLKVEWNRVELGNTTYPKNLGDAHNLTLNYKEHIHNTKIKLATRNNLLKKLANSK